MLSKKIRHLKSKFEEYCEKIFKYDGNQDFIEGNIHIYSIKDVDEFEN